MTWYTPMAVGYVADKRKVHVMGVAYDYDGILLCLSVIGPNTLTEAIHYDLQGQEHTIQITPAGSGYNRFVHSRKNHFTVIKRPIPDTSDHNLILINDTIKEPDKDFKWTFVPYLDEEDFKTRLYYRVKQIVSIPLKFEWREWLYFKGTTDFSDTARGLCQKAKTAVEGDRNWTAAGFSVGLIYNSQELWEKTVSEGLRRRQIFI